MREIPPPPRLPALHGDMADGAARRDCQLEIRDMVVDIGARLTALEEKVSRNALFEASFAAAVKALRKWALAGAGAAGAVGIEAAFDLAPKIVSALARALGG